MRVRVSQVLATVTVAVLPSLTGCSDTVQTDDAPGAGGSTCRTPDADSGVMCERTVGEETGAPRIYMRGTGKSVFSLDGRGTDGFVTVSLVSGDFEPPEKLWDGGLLSSLMIGDQIEVNAREHCEEWSGCRWFIVVRNAKDHSLISAHFQEQPDQLEAFAELLHIGLELESICTLATTDCYESEVQTQYRLLVEATDTFKVDPRSNAPLMLDGRQYRIWFGNAYTNSGTGQRMNGCVDMKALWWPGAVRLTIAP